MTKSQIKALDDFIAEYCPENHFSGTIRITERDEVTFERFIGMENIASGIPISADTVYTFYSLSKPFCAIGLLKLYDRGLVDLDAHPSKYVPEAAGFDPRVTIRQILCHISGLPDPEQDTDFHKRYPDPSDDPRNHIAELATYPRQSEPGTVGRYANINFVMTALIIENVSGMDYADYMAKEVLAVLGMTTAQVDKPDLVIPHRAQGYALDGDKVVPIDRSLWWMKGAGDIVGRVDDVYRLNLAIKNKTLLAPETWDMAYTPSPLNSMGMGCTVTDWYGKRRITHNGGHLGFRTFHVQLPEDDFDFILMSNCGWGNARWDFAEKIHDIVYGNTPERAAEIQLDRGYI